MNVGSSVAVMRWEVQGLCSECIFYDGGIINAGYFFLSCSICEHFFVLKISAGSQRMLALRTSH